MLGVGSNDPLQAVRPIMPVINERRLSKVIVHSSNIVQVVFPKVSTEKTAENLRRVGATNHAVLIGTFTLALIIGTSGDKYGFMKLAAISFCFSLQNMLIL
jgi:hypothetical protein